MITIMMTITMMMTMMMMMMTMTMTMTMTILMMTIRWGEGLWNWLTMRPPQGSPASINRYYVQLFIIKITLSNPLLLSL